MRLTIDDTHASAGPAGVFFALRSLALAALALLLSISLVSAAAAAAPPALFTRFGADEGLSQGAVLAITQDRQGYIWIGTEDGLNRFDGYELTHVMRDRVAANGLPNNWVASLAQDRKGQLWIGTAGGGVVRRDPQDGRFYAPRDAGGKSLVDPRAAVRALHFDRGERLWIGTRNAGLRVLDLRKNTARDYRRDLSSSASLSDDSVYVIAEDLNGALWIGTQVGLDRVDPATGVVTRFGDRLRALLGRGAEPMKVQALKIDSRGTIWIGTETGLVRFDPVSGALDLLRQRPNDKDSLPNDNVVALLEDADQRLWVGTANGLGLLDRRTDRFTNFRNVEAERSSLPHNNIVSLFEDSSGLLWIGTKSGGIARWNPRSWSFGHRRLGDGSDDNVTSFAEDRKGVLWVGTLGGGLVAQDRATGALTRYRRDPRNPASLSDDNVMAMLVDDADRLWIGTMRAGVERLDARRSEIMRFAHDPGNPASLGAPGVMSMLRDSRGRIWVGTYGGGIARIDPDTGQVSRYPVRRNAESGLSSDRATALAEDRTGLIWIGTDGGGLNVLDPTSRRFRAFAHRPDDPRSLSGDTVYAIHVDERGVVWVGTRGGGLDRVAGAPFGSDVVTFQNYAEAEGLPNSTVYGIESDPSGKLWLSTNRGLARFDPADGTIRSFNRSHGLQGDEFNFGAHYRSPGGELFFGGPRGYNGFFADRLRFNERPPPVVLTQFAKFNAPVDLGRTLESVSQLRLSHDDDVVSFRFAALDYTAPASNRYAYLLQGFDKDWVQAGTAREATYTNLSGGNYVFRVRGANSDGVWNTEGVALALNVEAPLWARWWALLLYFALFVCALFAVWLAQQRRLQREAAYARRLAAEVEERTEQLAQRNQDLERANQQLQDASVTDPLTGLGNRRFLRTAVEKTIADNAYSSPAQLSRFVLIVVDLDNLKPINDQHGHEAGDRVLIQVAEILRGLCRATDLVVRWGGDEFVMLCRGADLTSAAVLAERIRSTVAKQIFRIHDGLVARTSCSIGFAPFPFIAESPASVPWEQSLAFADAALYRAKRDRNDWIGWGGTALAAELPHLQRSIETDSDALIRQGALEVRRRALATEDTVDQLRALARGDTHGDAG